MSGLRAILRRLCGHFGRARREREWAAEFESHLEMDIADNLPSGMSREEARRQALIRFGGVEPVKESMRDRASLAWVDEALRDIRYALRGLRRSPGFAVDHAFIAVAGTGREPRDIHHCR